MDPQGEKKAQAGLKIEPSIIARLRERYGTDNVSEAIRLAAIEVLGKPDARRDIYSPDVLSRFASVGVTDLVPHFYAQDFGHEIAHADTLIILPFDFLGFLNQYAHLALLLDRIFRGQTTRFLVPVLVNPNNLSQWQPILNDLLAVRQLFGLFFDETGNMADAIGDIVYGRISGLNSPISVTGFPIFQRRAGFVLASDKTIVTAAPGYSETTHDHAFIFSDISSADGTFQRLHSDLVKWLSSNAHFDLLAVWASLGAPRVSDIWPSTPLNWDGWGDTTLS